MEKTIETRKEAWRRWWCREMDAPKLVGLTLTRRAAAKLLLFWLAALVFGALLWARGLDGYGLVAGGTMWLAGAWLLPELTGAGMAREED